MVPTYCQVSNIMYVANTYLKCVIMATGLTDAFDRKQSGAPGSVCQDVMMSPILYASKAISAVGVSECLGRALTLVLGPTLAGGRPLKLPVPTEEEQAWRH